MNVLPPPLSRANRKNFTELARAVKDSIEELLAEVDDALAPTIATK